MNSIPESLRQIIGVENAEIQCETAKVLEVTGRTCKIEILRTGLSVEGVRLQAGTTENGIFIKPVKNSEVVVCWVGKFAFVLIYTDIEEIVINAGKNKGLIKIENLVNRLNAIEKALNNLLTDYKAHNHLHPQGPTTGFVMPPTQQSIEETKESDIENTKIKH